MDLFAQPRTNSGAFGVVGRGTASPRKPACDETSGGRARLGEGERGVQRVARHVLDVDQHAAIHHRADERAACRREGPAVDVAHQPEALHVARVALRVDVDERIVVPVRAEQIPHVGERAGRGLGVEEPRLGRARRVLLVEIVVREVEAVVEDCRAAERVVDEVQGVDEAYAEVPPLLDDCVDGARVQVAAASLAAAAHAVDLDREHHGELASKRSPRAPRSAS